MQKSYKYFLLERTYIVYFGHLWFVVFIDVQPKKAALGLHWGGQELNNLIDHLQRVISNRAKWVKFKPW